MTVFSKLILIGLTLRVSLPAPLHADLQTVLQKTSASLLYGRLTEAKQITRAETNSPLPEADRQVLEEVHEMIDQFGSIDQYVLEYFQNQVGQNVQVYQDNRLEAFRVTLIRPPGTVLGVKVEHGVGMEVSIELDRIPKRQKAALAETMPVALRGLYLSLVAWEDQDLQLFQRAVGVTGHLSAPLKAEAIRRVQDERARRQEEAEAARAAAARIRVSGTENREWERFDEDKITRIRCDVIDDAGALGKGTGDTPVQTEGLQYDLYIPKGYNDNLNTWYPVLFIASPGGNAGMGRMAERLKRDRWVVVMLVESRNADSRWSNNFVAAHDDVMKRVRIAPGAKFATGMSGGARVVSSYPAIRPGFRGIILQAAGMSYGDDWDKYGQKLMEDYPAATAVATTMAFKEMNYRETYRLRILLNSKTPFRLEVWEGGHTWAPREVFDRVMDWMEETVFLKERRPAEPWQYQPTHAVPAEEMHPVAHRWFFDRTLARAERAQTPYEKVFHLSRLITIATLGGLLQDPDVQAAGRIAHQQLAELEQDPDVQRGREAEALYARFWEKYHDFEARIASMSGNPMYGTFTFKHTSPTLRAGEEALKLGEQLVETYPDTPQGKFLSGFLFGLRSEIEDGR